MIITYDLQDQRLDRFLKNTFPEVSFGQVQKIIRTGQIRINGKRVKQDARLNEGDELRLPPSLQNNENKKPKIAFNQKDRDFIESIILFEDAHVLILNKPNGLAVQGGSKTKIHLDGMLNSYIKKNAKPRLCHRLDKDTSGVLVLAKSAEVARVLTQAFKDHDMEKTYWALTTPAPVEDSGTIDARLIKSSDARSDGGEMMMHDPENGKKAITDFEVIDRAGQAAAFVAFYPRTGRTHQIRVHAAIIGCPLIGDRKYNPNPFPEEFPYIHNGLHLHAREIKFIHPATGTEMVVQADLPAPFLKSWKSFGFSV
jgi:23S rRNA pseudouridine955/2504/2580 synthase